jgi:hypothetical protein
MAELTNTFTQGKMNKDLDERLVPNGQYRDALNLEVSSSEGSNIGALQTVLGNSLVNSTVQASIPTDAACIGSVVDEENDNIYWFLTSSSFDAILELSGSSVTPVIVDTQSILNFGQNNFITGVNILDGVLYFTDDLNEPRQVDISYWKAKTQNSFTHTPGLAADRISLYKKGPLNSPVYKTLVQSLRGGAGTVGGIKTFVSLSSSGTEQVGTSVNINANSFVKEDKATAVSPNWELNDIIEFSREYQTFNGENTSSKFRFKITGVTSSVFTFELVSKSGKAEAGSHFYRTELEEGESIFKLKFPKFAYRFKYNNGQFSTISPFSSPAFIPGDYGYDSKKGFNTGMVNNVRKIEVEGWPKYSGLGTYSQDIKEIEVLYKESDDNSIYAVESLPSTSVTGAVKSISQTGSSGTSYSEGLHLTTGGSGSGLKVYVTTDGSGGVDSATIVESGEGYAQGEAVTIAGYASNAGLLISSVGSGNKFQDFLDIKDNQVLKALPSNQILRPYDAVPKKAKALDITANRLVFGNYEHNFDIVGNPTFSVSLLPATDSSRIKRKLSVKSDRTYQIGIVYQDEYGRQTPVFTDSSGVINVGVDKSDELSTIRVSTSHSNLPSDIKYYKYFVKETSNQYYNLPISSVYIDDETGNMYVSVHSSEVNKVSEEDVLVIKKESGSVPYTSKNSRFKVISKLSTPPDFLAYKDEVVYSTDYVEFDTNYDSGGQQNTKKAGLTPVPGHNTIMLDKAGRLQDDSTPNNVDAVFIQNVTKGSRIRFRRVGTDLVSKIYKIKHIEYGTYGDTEIEITFDREFGNDVNILYVDDSEESALAGVGIEKIEKVDDAGNSEYAGKFFIQLNNEVELKEALFGANDTENLNTVATNSNIHKNEQNNTFDIRQYFVEYSSMGSSGTLGAITTVDGYTVNIPSGYHLVIATENDYGDPRDKYETDPFARGLEKGNYLRFSAYPDTSTSPPTGSYVSAGEQLNYKILSVSDGLFASQTGDKKYWAIELDRDLETPWSSALDDRINNHDHAYTIDVRSFVSDKSFTPKDPALFEVEPKDGALDLYYETEKTHIVSEIGISQPVLYNNCFSFGNGVESDRIRDDFNAATLGKGVRVSTVFDDNYEEERVKNGLIFSQIYNGEAGVNRLNQFILAENITKSLSPTYGSIQKLHSRNTDLIAFCEDKCLKILANKDALFNADGNANVTSNNNVLGQAIPFSGEFGISKNPESFASYGFRSYFADKKRGVVLRLSRDGLTEISAKGMQDFFSDNLARSFRVNGSYDQEKNSYNITMLQPSNPDQTLSFKENVDGWSSRKSFLPESGLSINNSYFTFSSGKIYKHGASGSLVNNFYGVQYESSVTFLFNDAATAVKGFKTLNYSGDKSRAYNDAKDTITTKGWYADSIQTDMQSGFIPYFVKKENKWFNYIKGNELSIDTTSLAVQGLGVPFLTAPQASGARFQLTSLNSSLEKGDKLYFLVNGNPTEIGTVNGVSTATFSSGEPYGNVTVSTLVSSLPTTSDFLFFAKDTGPNLTSLTGYYAEVTMKNDNTADGPQELFSVATEIFQSSK